MRKLSIISICVIAISVVSSCDFLNDKEPDASAQNSTTTVEGISQEIKNKIAAQDTLMNALVLKVDTLAHALTQTQKENSELKAQVEKLESPKSTWGYMTLASLALAIVALILSLFRKGLRKEDVNVIFNYNLDRSQRIANIRADVNQLKSGLSNKTLPANVSLQLLEVRLRSVESALSRLSSKPCEDYNMTNSSATKNPEQPIRSNNTEYVKMGYANINSDNIFTKVFDSAQESCVFSIKFKNSNEGEFSIISLDKIKSRNGWQEIVEYSGSIEDATSFKVEEYGICKKYDDVTWQVVKKLKIKLLK